MILPHLYEEFFLDIQLLTIVVPGSIPCLFAITSEILTEVAKKGMLPMRAAKIIVVAPLLSEKRDDCNNWPVTLSVILIPQLVRI